MAGRYDEKVFTIRAEQGLAEAVQYYLFKKFKQKRYVFQLDEVWDLFGRYFSNDYKNPQQKSYFKYCLEKEANKNIYEFGNFDCRNTLYFAMDARYKIPVH